MRGRLTGCYQAVVAGRAVVHDARMGERASGEAAGFVTDAAVLGGGHVVGLLAQGGNTVVTGGAVIHHTGVIKHRANKCAGVMAHTAILGRGDVRGRLTSGVRTVMTRGAITTDPRMTENRRFKRRGVVAEVTILGSGHMVDRRILTGSKLSVVTPFAAVAHTGVVKHPAGKTGSDMAHGTIFRGGYMVDRLAKGRRTVVARGAVIHDPRVIEYGR